MTNIDQSIFKAYDVRGIYPTQLNEEVAYLVAKACARLLQSENPGKQLTIAVGADMRTSSPSLKKEIIKGLTESGVNVVDIGLVSSTTYYFAVGHYGYDGGIQITASHNAKEYNGLKIVRRGGIAMGGKTGIYEIARMVSEETFEPAAQPGTVTVQEGVTEQAIEEYLKFAGKVNIKPFNIVIDPANAMGILDYEALFQKIPGNLIKMNFELDGTFPAHEADPLKDANTKDLRERVVAEGADFGLASDGDSDRLFIVDDTGQTIPSPILYTILAEIELEQYPTETYAYEIRMGRLVETEFENKPAKLVQTAVGHSIIKQSMIENNAVFGGEISGHYFFRMPFGTFEAPALLVIKLLDFLSKQDLKLSEIVNKYRRFVSSGEINTRMDNREEIEQKIKLIKQKYADGKQIFLDGIKVDYPDYWFSIRASNTEPLLRLIVESSSKDIMEAKRDEVLALINS